MRTRLLTLPPADCSIEWPSQSSAGGVVVWIKDSQSMEQLSTSQAQMQGSELAHSKMFIICK